MTHAPVASTPPAAPLAWLAERAALDEDMQPLVESAASAGALVDTLLDVGHVPDAIRCVGVALPSREGVWWAWVSARHAVQASTKPPKPDTVATMQAIEAWIGAPDDDRRREAWKFGQLAGMDSPAGCAAAAVFFSGGSIAPSSAPMVPPPAGLTATMVATSVLLSAAAGDPKLLADIARAYVAQGVEVIKRMGGWEPALDRARMQFDQERERHEQATQPAQPAQQPVVQPPRNS